VMMTDTAVAVARLAELKALGVRLAMDDFGTGYSSLSHLSQMPVDILKMDRSFMRGGESLQQSALATAVLALGETLKLQVVAEGIEHMEQWETMHRLGCQFGQGYLFGKPMASDDVVEYLREHAARPVGGALTHAA
jgi:EAL domain-containing protein (putative c-di-GMP-specific phosphodiesterase class I)